MTLWQWCLGDDIVVVVFGQCCCSGVWVTLLQWCLGGIVHWYLGDVAAMVVGDVVVFGRCCCSGVWDVLSQRCLGEVVAVVFG